MRRHRLDSVSLVFGLVFCCIVLVWALWQLEVVHTSALGWLLPAILVVAGLAGVAASTSDRG